MKKNVFFLCFSYNALNPINFLEGPQIDPSYLQSITPFDTVGDFENYLKRLELFPQQVSIWRYPCLNPRRLLDDLRDGKGASFFKAKDWMFFGVFFLLEIILSCLFQFQKADWIDWFIDFMVVLSRVDNL